MKENKFGIVVLSKAGHDKNEFFVIMETDGEYVYLADGRLRTVEKPKKKNVKHVEYTKHFCGELVKKQAETGRINNEDIKYALKLYRAAGHQ